MKFSSQLRYGSKDKVRLGSWIMLESYNLDVENDNHIKCLWRNLDIENGTLTLDVCGEEMDEIPGINKYIITIF